jgi:hypothetical protein
MIMSRQTDLIPIEFIEVGPRLRHVNDEDVERLAASMKLIGLRTPITVRYVDSMVIDGEEVMEVPVLVTGHTRLLAAKALGWDRIEAFVAPNDESDATRWEIAENLHRTQPTKAEIRAAFKEWARIEEGKPKGGRGKKGGVKEFARTAGVPETTARRAIEETAPNGAVYDQPQVRRVSVAPEPVSGVEVLERHVAKLMADWNSAPPQAREEFLCRIGAALMRGAA